MSYHLNMAKKTTRSEATSPTRSVLYIRVSTEEQAREGISLKAQEATLTAYCAMRNLCLVEVVVDAGVSAGKPLAARNGGQRVLDLVKRKNVTAVVAFKLDRLFRDCADCLDVTREWDKRGVALHLVDLGGQAVDTSTAMGRFFLTVMAGCAELERNQIRERTSAAMAHKSANGEYVGGEAPYGYAIAADGVSLTPVHAEQQVIAEVHRLRGAGMSLNAIAGELAKRGFKPRQGQRWYAQQVKRMLARTA